MGLPMTSPQGQHSLKVESTHSQPREEVFLPATAVPPHSCPYNPLLDAAVLEKELTQTTRSSALDLCAGALTHSSQELRVWAHVSRTSSQFLSKEKSWRKAALLQSIPAKLLAGGFREASSICCGSQPHGTGLWLALPNWFEDSGALRDYQILQGVLSVLLLLCCSLFDSIQYS